MLLSVLGLTAAVTAAGLVVLHSRLIPASPGGARRWWRREAHSVSDALESPANASWDADDWRDVVFARKLGKGEYASVYVGCFSDGTNSTACSGGRTWGAFKLIDCDLEKSSFDGEMAHVVRELYGSAAGTMRSSVVRFVEEREYAVVSRLANCVLTKLVDSPALEPVLPLHVVRVLGGRMLRELAALHARGFMHRDIKPDNVMLTWTDAAAWPRLEIGDFSLATFAPGSADPDVITIWWRPLEVLLGLPYSDKVDVFSVGVIIAQMASGEHVTVANNETGVTLDLWARLGQPSEERWPEAFAHPSRALDWGLAPDPAGVLPSRPLRLPASHERLAPVLATLLAPHPDDRASAEGALADPFWTEAPTAQEAADASAWLAAERRRETRVETYRADPTLVFARGSELEALSDAASDRRADARYVRRAFADLPHLALRATVGAAVGALLPRSTLHVALSFVDRTLEAARASGAAPASAENITALAAASLFVANAFMSDDHSDLEPLGETASLAAHLQAPLSVEVLQGAVHEILAGTRCHMLSDADDTAVHESDAWVETLDTIDALLEDLEMEFGDGALGEEWGEKDPVEGEGEEGDDEDPDADVAADAENGEDASGV